MIARRMRREQVSLELVGLAAAIVGNRERDDVGAPAQRQPGTGRIRVADDVEQRLAGDLDERVLGRGRDRMGVA